MPRLQLSRCPIPLAISTLLVAFNLVSCSTSHAPVTLEPYFGNRQPAYTGAELLSELNALESKPALLPLEKKRLFDIYQAELAYLKASSPRFASATGLAAAFKPEADAWENEKAEIEKETRAMSSQSESDAPVAKPMESTEARKVYSEILQLWNRDNPEGAVAKIQSALEKNGLVPSDQNKFLNIRFRIALENAEINAAGDTFAKMRANEPCGFETVNAGFLYSLVLLGEGKADNAREIFDGLCVIDHSIAENIRRDYWRARLIAKSEPDTAKALYEKILKHPIPGYHTFLSAVQLGVKYELPKAIAEIPARPFLAGELSVKGSIHDDWVRAEERLRYNLKRDAQVYLNRASRRLCQDPDEDDVPALLYTAHLFHASGNHLEAMRLYSEVATLLAEDSENATQYITPTVIQDMFPRPFVARADWVAGMWQMDPDFVYSIARQESAFNPTAVSITDARGWMQLMPPLARSIAKSWGLDGKFNDRYLFHVDENLKFGVFHLRQLQDLLGHPALIAAAYNAGATRAVNWKKRYGAYPLDIFIELVPINETKNYMKLVLRNYYVYKALRDGAVDPKIVAFQFEPATVLP